MHCGLFGSIPGLYPAAPPPSCDQPNVLLGANSVPVENHWYTITREKAELTGINAGRYVSVVVGACEPFLIVSIFYQSKSENEGCWRFKGSEARASGEFPGGPVVRTPILQAMQHGQKKGRASKRTRGYC